MKRRLLDLGWAVSDALIRLLAALDPNATVQFTRTDQEVS